MTATSMWSSSRTIRSTCGCWANELPATRIAERIGLPVPHTEVIEVGEWLVRHTPDLGIQLAARTIACQPGLQFGSRYVVDPLEGQVLDYLPDATLPRARNPVDFAGVLAFDVWTSNVDARQVVFWRKPHKRGYIQPRSSIRDIASTPGNGAFRIRRCEASTPGTKSTPA